MMKCARHNKDLLLGTHVVKGPSIRLRFFFYHSGLCCYYLLRTNMYGPLLAIIRGKARKLFAFLAIFTNDSSLSIGKVN